MAQTHAPKPLSRPDPEHPKDADRFQSAYLESMSFFEVHRAKIIGGLAVLGIAIAAFVGWRYLSAQNADRAQRQLGAMLTHYESGDWDTALNGTDDAPGLLEIADETGSSSAAFFAADALFQLGRFDEAIDYFQRVESEGIVGASALAGQAAVLEQRGEFGQAAQLYERAAGAYDSAATTPEYLLDASRAHLEGGERGAAVALLERVLEEYEGTSAALEAEMRLGELLASG